MSKSVKVSDLKDQTGVPGPHPFLYCECCGSSFSSNAGDYFTYPHDHVFTCCEQPVRLCKKILIYEDVII